MAIVNLLQHNIQSLTKNKSVLDFFLNKWNIDICLLSEIFNYEDNNLRSKIKNYNVISKKRQDNYGGVAIVFKNSIKIKKYSLTQAWTF